MKKRTFMIVLVCFCVSFLAFSIMVERCEAKKPIKLGVVTAKSSFLAYHGKYAEWGYNMSVEEVNENGGVLGRPIQIIWRDTKCKPDVATREARDLVYGEKVDFLLGCFITSTTNAVSAFAKENKVLFLGSGSGVGLTEELWHRHFFRTSASTSMIAKAEAIALKEEGYRKVWFIAPDYAFGHMWTEGSKRYLKELMVL